MDLRQIAKLAILSALFLCTSTAIAQTVVIDSLPRSGISLHKQASIADVGQEKFDIGYVLLNSDKLHFVPLKNENYDLGFTKNYYWVEFSIHNNSASAAEYYLETARPITDGVTLYQIADNGKIKRYTSGDGGQFKDKSYRHRKSIFKIQLDPKATAQFYLHLKSDGEVISVPLLLLDADGLMEITSLEHFTFGIFYGIILIAAILYFFFFFAIKERTFLFYSLYVFFIGLMQFALDGYFFQFITPDGGWFSASSVLIFANISTFFLGRYSQLFLNTRENAPILNKFFNGLYLLLILQTILLFIPSIFHYCYPLANIFGLLVLSLIVSSVLRLLYRNIYVDRYFIIGIFFLISGFVIFILNNFGQIDTFFLTQNSTKFGTGLEIIFLSLSMANLIGKIKSEREEFSIVALERSEEISEMKSYFLSNISHELRTPLNAIMNLSQNLKNHHDQDVKSNGKTIHYSSQTLLSSVNDILDFSKIEKGELQLENTAFSPAEELKQISEIAKIRAVENGLDFTFNCKGNLPNSVLGDKYRLSQIVNNILNNAIKFTSSGYVKFELGCEKIECNKVNILISISDSGIGISEEKLHTIFGSFTQNMISHKRKYGGLGLGLYIVKSLVDLKNGTIEIKSLPDEGTICKIAIAYEILEQEMANPTAMKNRFDLEGKTILVVEDNSMNQLVIKMIAKKWQNTTIVFTANGSEGIEALKSKQFDLILMDLQMPVMDGYEATIAIRNGEAGDANTNIPIIAVTADVMETTKLKVKEIGMDDYLSKPLNSELLFEKIYSLLYVNQNV